MILGAGPAGWAVATACAQRGVAVALAAPSPVAAWPRNYGAWADELPGTAAQSAVERRFDRPMVATDAQTVVLDASYVKLSTQRLQDSLVTAAVHSRVAIHDARASAIEHDAAQSRIRFSDGRVIAARVVIDATGAASPFVARQTGPAPAFQAAYGELVEVAEHPYAPGEMALMDFRSLGDDDAAPTFLYAMPLSDQLLFVEETSLVARPALSQRALRSAFQRRLGQLGLHVRRTLERETCLIPMGLPLPRRDQRTVAFGAAASFTHPASGYQLMRALRLAEPVAEAIVEGLEHDPARASRQAYDAMWPQAEVAAWSLYRFGMDVLADMDRARLSQFLTTFLQLKDGVWQRFMDGRLSPPEILMAMLRVFGGGTNQLRRDLLGAARNDMGPLLRAALRGVAS